MAGPIVQAGASISCPHGGTAQFAPGSARVLATAPVATMADQFMVAGCPFQIPTPGGPKPQPCVSIRWTVPAARVLAMGAPVITQASVGLCFSAEQIPQGAPIVSVTQPRVVAQ